MHSHIFTSKTLFCLCGIWFSLLVSSVFAEDANNAENKVTIKLGNYQLTGDASALYLINGDLMLKSGSKVEATSSKSKYIQLLISAKDQDLDISKVLEAHYDNLFVLVVRLGSEKKECTKLPDTY